MPWGKVLGVAAPLPEDVRLESLGVSSDGRLVWAVGKNAATVWDAKTGERKKRYALSPRSRATGVPIEAQFSRNGARVALLEDHGSVLRVEDVASGAVLRRWTLEGKKERPDFLLSEDGSRLAMMYRRDLSIEVYAVDEERAPTALPGVDGVGKASMVFVRSEGESQLATLDPVRGGLFWELDRGTSRPFQEPDVSEVRLATSPNGEVLATVGVGGIVQVFDVSNGREMNGVIAMVGGPRSTSVAVSNDGSRVAVAGGGGTIELWDSVESRKVATLAQGMGDGSVAVTADGLLAGHSGGEPIRFWNIESGTPVTLESHERVISAVSEVNWLPGDSAAVNDSAGPRLWDLQCGVAKQVEHWDDGLVAVASEAELIVSVREGRDVRVTSAASGAVVREASVGPEFPAALAVSRDGRRAAVSDRGQITLLDVADLSVLWTRPAPRSDQIRKMAVSPDGSRVVVVVDWRVLVYDGATGTQLFDGLAPVPEATPTAFSPDGGRVMLYPRPEGSRVLLLDVESGSLRELEFSDLSISAAAWFSEDGVVLGTADGRLATVNVDTGQLRSSRAKGSGRVASLSVRSGDRAVLAGYADGTLRSWNVEGLAFDENNIDAETNGGDLEATDRAFEVEVLKKGATQTPTPVCESGWGPSPDSLPACARHRIERSALATGRLGLVSEDGRLLTIYNDTTDTLDVVEVASGRRVSALRGARGSLVFSPDGSSLVTRNGGVSRWDVKTGRRLTSWGKDLVTDIAESPDGTHWAVLGDANGNAPGISLLDPEGNLVSVLESKWSAMNSLYWSPKGTHVLSQRPYGFFSIWSAASGKLTYSSETDSSLPKGLATASRSFASFDSEGRAVVNTPEHRYVREESGRWQIDAFPVGSVSDCAMGGATCIERKDGNLEVFRFGRADEVISIGVVTDCGITDGGRFAYTQGAYGWAVWDLESGTRATPRVHPPIVSLAFGADGSLVTTSTEGTSRRSPAFEEVPEEASGPVRFGTRPLPRKGLRCHPMVKPSRSLGVPPNEQRCRFGRPKANSRRTKSAPDSASWRLAEMDAPSQ